MHWLCSWPGFLHGGVCADIWIDDLDEAYQTLRLALKRYFLLEEEEAEKHNRASPDSTSMGVYLFTCSDNH